MATIQRKNNGGRPTVMTPAVVAKIIEAFKLDVTVEEACTYANISKDTYYRRIKEDEEFSDEMERARMYASMVARQTVIREIQQDGDLALKYLERKRKAEFSPRSEHQVGDLNLEEILRKQANSAPKIDWTAPDEEDESKARAPALGEAIESLVV